MFLSDGTSNRMEIQCQGTSCLSPASLECFIRFICYFSLPAYSMISATRQEDCRLTATKNSTTTSSSCVSQVSSDKINDIWKKENLCFVNKIIFLLMLQQRTAWVWVVRKPLELPGISSGILESFTWNLWTRNVSAVILLLARKTGSQPGLPSLSFTSFFVSEIFGSGTINSHMVLYKYYICTYIPTFVLYVIW